MAAVPSIGRAGRVESLVPPEASATQSLYERYANQIFGYCLHQLGSREEAEDAVQSTFLNAFRGFRRGVVPEQESAWLFKIAHNVCLSRRRSTWRRGRIESPADFEVVEELTPAPSTRADELMGLQDVLEQMPDSQRRAILLREWQGLSYREIAEELELSQSAVETLIFRARRALAEGLEQPPEPARVSWRKRIRTSANLGGLFTWAKSLFVGATAAKVAGTAAVVAVSSIAATGPLERHTRHATSAAPVAPKRLVPRGRSTVAAASTPVVAAGTLLDRPRTTAPELAPASASRSRQAPISKRRAASLQPANAAPTVVETPAPAPPAAATPPPSAPPSSTPSAPPAEDATPAQAPRRQPPAATEAAQPAPPKEQRGAQKDAKKGEKDEHGSGATAGNDKGKGNGKGKTDDGDAPKDRGNNGKGNGNGQPKAEPTATVPPAAPAPPAALPYTDQADTVDYQSAPQASPQPAPIAVAPAAEDEAHGNSAVNGKDGERGNSRDGSKGKGKGK